MTIVLRINLAISFKRSTGITFIIFDIGLRINFLLLIHITFKRFHDNPCSKLNTLKINKLQSKKIVLSH